jgi:alanyl-tRNA synthetase
LPQGRVFLRNDEVIMNHNELRQKYLDFFQKNGHAIITPTSLVPENDPTTLFTSSGMQQLVPYLKGESHPMGKRLVNSQPSFRTEDIEEVGDNQHTTFFEMLGNWSLGDYFKKDQLSWLWQFLTEELGLDKNRLYVTVFGGSEGCKVIGKNGERQDLRPDVDSISFWRDLLDFDPNIPVPKGEEGFDEKIKIYKYDASKNWWSRSGTPDKMPVGEIGGPDSEIFWDFDPENKLKLHENSTFANQPCHVNCDCGRFLEIGNSVFMEYVKTEDGFKPLPAKNVDFGGGLERMLMVVQDKRDIFQTSIFAPIITEIEKATQKKYEGEFIPMMRTITDHIKAATFMIAEGVEPSNKQQGYICRRLLRRAAVKVYSLMGEQTDPTAFFIKASQAVREIYQGVYFENEVNTVRANSDLSEKGENFSMRDESRARRLNSHIDQIISVEVAKFIKTLQRGIRKIEKTNLGKIDGIFAFNLFQTDGIPFEITQEILAKKDIVLSKSEFDQEFAKHKKLSQTASKGMFAGGLADHSEVITRLHTATHLLNQALRQVLGRDDVSQVGSNITAERLRFDFTYGEKLTDEQVKRVQYLVNEQITKDLSVTFETMDKDEALKVAIGAFSQRYGDKLKVYSIEGFSKEICGGPHVERTGELGKFELGKQEAVGAGKRRIYGFLK